MMKLNRTKIFSSIILLFILGGTISQLKVENSLELQLEEKQYLKLGISEKDIKNIGRKYYKHPIAFLNDVEESMLAGVSTFSAILQKSGIVFSRYALRISRYSLDNQNIQMLQNTSEIDEAPEGLYSYNLLLGTSKDRAYIEHQIKLKDDQISVILCTPEMRVIEPSRLNILNHNIAQAVENRFGRTIILNDSNPIYLIKVGNVNLIKSQEIRDACNATNPRMMHHAKNRYINRMRDLKINTDSYNSIGTISLFQSSKISREGGNVIADNLSPSFKDLVEQLNQYISEDMVGRDCIVILTNDKIAVLRKMRTVDPAAIQRATILNNIHEGIGLKERVSRVIPLQDEYAGELLKSIKCIYRANIADLLSMSKTRIINLTTNELIVLSFVPHRGAESKNANVAVTRFFHA